MAHVLEQYPNAQLRWAIQMATVNTFKYRGYNTLARVMGAQSIEHSFTQFSQIWCDENDIPLRDKKTGKLFPPYQTRAWINPGAIDPKDGSWTPMTINIFNKNAEAYKLGVFAFYGDDLKTFDTELMPENPVTICVGDELDIEREWYVRQNRALALNSARLPYSIYGQNCHSAICYLHGDTPEKAEEFSAGRFFRWAANPNILNLPDIQPPRHLSLNELRGANYHLSIDVSRCHDPKDNQSVDLNACDTI